MKKMHHGRAAGRLTGCLLAVLAMSLAPAGASVRGTLVLKSGPEKSGNLRYRASSKLYEVSDGRTMLTVPLDRVLRVIAPAPPQLAEALRKIQTAPSAAIAPLIRIMDEYQMLEHDVPAAAGLMQAYVKSGQFKQAAEVGEKMMRDNPLAPQCDDFVNALTEALLAAERYPQLEQMLGQIIKEGSRSAVAWAQIKRGDIDVRKGDFKDALLDGYLRTVVLFGDVKAAQPEALFRAAECFDRLGQGPYAEKMRKNLLEQYPQSAYADRLKSAR